MISLLRFYGYPCANRREMVGDVFTWVTVGGAVCKKILAQNGSIGTIDNCILCFMWNRWSLCLLRLFSDCKGTFKSACGFSVDSDWISSFIIYFVTDGSSNVDVLLMSLAIFQFLPHLGCDLLSCFDLMVHLLYPNVLLGPPVQFWCRYYRGCHHHLPICWTCF